MNLECGDSSCSIEELKHAAFKEAQGAGLDKDLVEENTIPNAIGPVPAEDVEMNDQPPQVACTFGNEAFYTEDQVMDPVNLFADHLSVASSKNEVIPIN